MDKDTRRRVVEWIEIVVVAVVTTAAILLASGVLDSCL